MSLRIISGIRRGKRLKTIPGPWVRPTADRVREAVFNILQHQVANRRVLDLFCGTGAMGLEALSRGAKWAAFVDIAGPSLAAATCNIQSCGFEDRAEVIRWDIGKNLDCLARLAPPADLVFLDPPYDAGLLEGALAHLRKACCLGDDALLVAESRRDKTAPDSYSGYELLDRRVYGKTLVSFLRHMV